MPEKQNRAERLADGDVGGRLLSTAWVVALAGTGVIFFTSHFQYSFGVFVKPLIDNFGWSRAAVSSIASGRSLMTALLSPVAGMLTDRYGARRLVLVGVLLSGLGFLLGSRASSLWQFYLSFSVLLGIGNGVILSSTVATVTRWFGAKSARANGVTMSGLSLAQTVLPPVATYLLVHYRWEASLLILGATAWLMGILSWNFIQDPPASPKKQPPEPAPAGRIIEADSQKGGHEFTLSEAMHTPTFWMMFLIYVISAISFQMVVVHIVVAAVDMGIAVGAAAIILTIIGATSTLGRLTLTGLADKIGGRTLLALSLGLQAGAFLALARTSELVVLYIIAAVYGLMYGSIMPLMPTMTGNFFGLKWVGSIFGMMNIGYLGGAAIGPLVAGYIFDLTGSYEMAFVSAGILMLGALLFCLRLRLPRKESPLPRG